MRCWQKAAETVDSAEGGIREDGNKAVMFRQWKLQACLLSVALASATVPAGAKTSLQSDTTELRAWCTDGATSQLVIRGCSGLIADSTASDADLSVAHYNRAIQFRKIGQYDRAVEDYDRALALQPDDAGTYDNRGIAYVLMGDYERGLQDFDKAIELQPREVSAYFNRALTHERMGHLEKAFADIQHVLKLGLKSGAVYRARCSIRLKTGHLDEALADCQEAVRRQPRNPEFLDTLAFVHLRRKSDVQARATYDTALALAPWQPVALYGRGIAKRRMGDIASGDTDMATAKAIEPDVAQRFAGYGVRP